KSCVSAESRLAARLKLVRVRVEFSKNRLKTIFPCSAGTFLRLRFETWSISSAVSRIARISSRDSSSRPSRCRRVQGLGAVEASPSRSFAVLTADSSWEGETERAFSRSPQLFYDPDGPEPRHASSSRWTLARLHPPNRPAGGARPRVPTAEPLLDNRHNRPGSAAHVPHGPPARRGGRPPV